MLGIKPMPAVLCRPSGKTSEQTWLNFQTGTTLDSMMVNISEVARQAVSDSAVDIGNSFTYEVLIDLPAVAASGINLTAEFFSVSATTGN